MNDAFVNRFDGADPDEPTPRLFKNMVARRDSALIEARSFLTRAGSGSTDERAALLHRIDRALEPVVVQREAPPTVQMTAVDTDAVAWAYATLGEATLGEADLPGSAPENARMSDRLFAMLRGSAAVPNTDAFPITVADQRRKFEKWAAVHWPNSNPPESAWTGWFAHAKEGAQEPHWRRSYEMAVDRLVLAAKYMTAAAGTAFEAEWKTRRAALRAAAAGQVEIESRTVALLRRAMAQLERWVTTYGENDPDWLPPAGDVVLMEDVADHLAWGSNAAGPRESGQPDHRDRMSP